MAEQYKISLGVDLDTSDLQTQINNGKNKVAPLKIDIDLKHAQQQIDTIKSQIKSLDGIKIQVDLGNSFGSSNSGIKQATNEIKNIQSLAKKIGNLEVKIGKLDTKSNINQIKELERQLQILKVQYDQTVKTLNAQGIEGFGGAVAKEFVEARNKLAEFEAKLVDTKTELAKSIKIRFDEGELNVVPELTKGINQLANTYPKLTTGLEKVKTALKEVEVAAGTEEEVADVDKLIAAHERLEHAIKNVKNQTSQYKNVEKNDGFSNSLAIEKQSALLKLRGLFEEGSEAARKYGARAKELAQNLNRCGNIDGVREVNKQIANLGREIDNAKVKTQTFGQSLRDQWEQYKSYFSVASLISYGTQALRKRI